MKQVDWVTLLVAVGVVALFAVGMCSGCAPAPAPMTIATAEKAPDPMIRVGSGAALHICDGDMGLTAAGLPEDYRNAMMFAIDIWNSSFGYEVIVPGTDVFVVPEKAWVAPPSPMPPLHPDTLGVTKWRADAVTGCAKPQVIVLDDDGFLHNMNDLSKIHVVSHEIGHAFGLAHWTVDVDCDDEGPRNLMCPFVHSHADGIPCVLNCVQAHALKAVYPRMVMPPSCR